MIITWFIPLVVGFVFGSVITLLLKDKTARWYDWIFGGRKSMSGVLAALLLTFTFCKMTIELMAAHWWEYMIGILIALGIIVYGNIKEHQAKNGNNK
jgi:hypothetical protein